MIYFREKELALCSWNDSQFLRFVMAFFNFMLRPILRITQCSKFFADRDSPSTKNVKMGTWNFISRLSPRNQAWNDQKRWTVFLQRLRCFPFSNRNRLQWLEHPAIQAASGTEFWKN